MGSSIIVIIIVTVYLLFMPWIGRHSPIKISTSTDFMVAGRRLGPFLIADTPTAMEIGGGSSLGVVQNGMSGFGLSASWYIIATGIAFIVPSFVVPEFRAAAVKMVPEHFRRRYGRFCGVIIVVTMLLPPVGLTAGQFIASAVILFIMLSIDYQVAVIIAAIVVTVYFIVGGLWSVTLTDFAQVFLIVTDMIIAAPFAMNYAGGRGNVASNIPKGTLSLLQGYDLFGIISFVIMYTTIFSAGQEAVPRFYAARDEKAARGGARLATLVSFIYAFAPTTLGAIMLALTNMGKLSPVRLESVGVRYVLLVLAVNTMSALICGLLFAGIISATMSSSDSDLFGAGSIFADDTYKAVPKPDASSQSVMKVTKIVMCLMDLAFISIVLFNTQSIVSILVFCFTLRAAGPFSPYVMGHYRKKASIVGTIASLIAGTIMVVYLEHVSKGVFFGIKFSQPIIPDLTAAFICFIISSLAMPPEEETMELMSEEDDWIRIQQESNGDLNGM